MTSGRRSGLGLGYVGLTGIIGALGLICCVSGQAFYKPGSFAPQDLSGIFALDTEGSSENCAESIEHVAVDGEKDGGFYVGRSVDGNECGNTMRVVPGANNVGGQVGRGMQELSRQVKGLMTGADSEGDCGDMGKGTWLFAQDSGAKVLRVDSGKSVNLAASERNAVFVGEDSKTICRYLSTTERKTRGRGRKKRRRKRPSSEEEAEESGDADDDDDDDIDLSECFSADATVKLESGSTKCMKDLQVGDRVLASTSGVDRYSDVVLFTHRDDKVNAQFVEIITSKATLHVTPGHYLYVNDKLAPAGSIRVGDKLVHTTGEDTVVSIDKVSKSGLFNPQTVDGDIVVNGILASTFTTAVHPTLAKGLMAPIKAAYACGVPVFQGMFDSGAGRFAPVLRLVQSMWPAASFK